MFQYFPGFQILLAELSSGIFLLLAGMYSDKPRKATTSTSDVSLAVAYSTLPYISMTPQRQASKSPSILPWRLGKLSPNNLWPIAMETMLILLDNSHACKDRTAWYLQKDLVHLAIP